MVKYYHNLYPLRNRQHVKYKTNTSLKYLRILVLKINQQIILHRW